MLEDVGELIQAVTKVLADAQRADIGLFTMMVGTLQLARAVSDPKLADEVLDEGIQDALAFVR